MLQDCEHFKKKKKKKITSSNIMTIKLITHKRHVLLFKMENSNSDGLKKIRFILLTCKK
jgi:hypothetical protein